MTEPLSLRDAARVVADTSWPYHDEKVYVDLWAMDDLRAALASQPVPETLDEDRLARACLQARDIYNPQTHPFDWAGVVIREYAALAPSREEPDPVRAGRSLAGFGGPSADGGT
jgi:hypothetical protein